MARASAILGRVTHSDRHPGQDLSDEALRTAVICPYLRAVDGAWRSARPSREHRCTALAPPTVLALDKQRRLCLAAEHTGCPTYVAARADQPARLADFQAGQGAGPGPRPTGGLGRDDPKGVTRWRFTRPAPFVIDGSGGPSVMAMVLRGRGVQALLVGLLLVAFAAVAVGRFSGPGSAAIPSPSPDPTSSVTPTVVEASPSPAPTASPAPTPAPTPTPTPAPTPTPEPSAATYVVQSGDTLSGIAARFGTTVAVLQELNGIENPSRIRVGLVLILP